MPALPADHLTKRYADVVAVDDLSFALEPGTITGFLGPNGAGKTTTLRLSLGLAEPTAGAALVLGRRYCELERPMRRAGAVLESGDFDPGRSARNHVANLEWLLYAAARKRAIDMLQLQPGARIVDVACGTGANFALIEQRIGPAGELV